MKLPKISKLAMLAVMCVGALFFAVSCSDDDDDDEEDQKSGIDFKNYSVDYSIKVRNNTAKSLVAFKGNPSKANLIGGIPANATNHGLPKKSSLFTGSSDFTLFVVTEDDYIKYKKDGDFAALSNTPFARLYAYYNENSPNQILYDISSVMGGSSTITLQNNTQYNVELRKDSVYGETIGYTAAGTLNTTFYVEKGDYSLFPVFRKYDKRMNEIVTVYPKDSNGYPYIEFFNLADKADYELNALDWSTNVNFAASSAFICINNQSGTGINFYSGDNPVVTSTGGKIINKTGSLVFEVPMPSVGTGDKKAIATKASVNGYKIGTAASQAVAITTGANDVVKADDQGILYLEAGKLYTLTVTGENYYSLQCAFSKEVVDIGTDVVIE